MARPSPVRDAIAQLLGASERHDWGIDDVLAAVHELGVAADYSSVFRGLARLEQEGTIRRVDLGDGKARYEGLRTHHEHVRCERCGAIDEVPGCAVSEPESSFLITGHQLLFSGVCPGCQP